MGAETVIAERLADQRLSYCRLRVYVTEGDNIVYARLGFSQETIDALDKCSVPVDRMQKLRAVFFSDWTVAEQILQEMASVQILAAYLQLIPDAQEHYQKRGIPENILWDGLQDIGIWSREHQKRFGRAGLMAWPWVARTLRMEVFRLGRLQFEPHILERPIHTQRHDYPAGIPVIDVHIPAELPLDAASVRASFGVAKSFFSEHFSEDFALYHCHSWLLSSQLQDILPSDSRILQFQSLFDVYGHTQERQGEERVFGMLLDDPSDYPENTSLQRKMKAYLLSGGKVNVGMGIIALK